MRFDPGHPMAALAATFYPATMHFGFSAEQEALHRGALTFAQRDLGPGVEGRDAWDRLAAFGATGLCLPARWGGQGLDAVTTARVLEGLGEGADAVGPLFALGAHLLAVAAPLARFGDDAQRSAILPRLCDGSVVGAFAATEADAGSDSAALQCRATAEGSDRYRLDGAKTFVTNATDAGLFLITAITQPAGGLHATSAFLVDRGAPGLTVGPTMSKMGLAGAPMAEVVLEGCAVPTSRRLGREGQGAAVMRHAMSWERALVLAPQLGRMARWLATSVDYARTRRQSGKPIGQHQAVSHRVADMALRLERARLLVYRAAWAIDRGERAVLHGALAKLEVSEAAVANHLDALRVHGGGGYMTELGIEREVRDAIGGLLHSGTSDIQRNVIAALLGL